MSARLASIVIASILIFASVAFSGAEHHENDAAAIQEAVLNYANSLYEMKPELVDSSVHPKLQKVGYWPAKDGEGYDQLWMNFEELRDLAAHLNQDKIFDPETARREVKILDQLDKIAVVRLDAEWGVDFLELVKQDGNWSIVNVVWQSSPDAE